VALVKAWTFNVRSRPALRGMTTVASENNVGGEWVRTALVVFNTPMKNPGLFAGLGKATAVTLRGALGPSSAGGAGSWAGCPVDYGIAERHHAARWLPGCRELSPFRYVVGRRTGLQCGDGDVSRLVTNPATIMAQVQYK